MLIIPIEKKPDWRRPPLATLLLILLNCLVFFSYQGDDEQRWQTAIEFYQQHDLLGHEAELYLQYRKQRDDSDFWRELPAEQTLERDLFLLYSIAQDTGFDHYARNRAAATDSQWLFDRERFEELRDRLSVFAYGFSPSQPDWYRWFTAMFLHGDFGHLLGNMVFLFIFGYTLEIALGRLPYVGLYLLSGVAATGLHALIEASNEVYLVGASGAIAGLMGAYLAVYGRRRIHFFYSIIFYADYFRAPALIVLPVWLLKELYGVWFSDDQVAYWAHIGGLIAGFVAVVCSQRLGWLKIDRDYLDNVDPDAPLRQGLDRINDFIAQLKRPQALQACEALIKQFPARVEPWQKYLDVARMQPDSREYHQVCFRLLHNASRRPELLSLAHATLTEYRRSPRQPALTEAVCADLAGQLCRRDFLESLELLTQRLLQLNPQHSGLPRLLGALVNLLSKCDSHRSKAERYRKLLRKHFPDSAERSRG